MHLSLGKPTRGSGASTGVPWGGGAVGAEVRESVTAGDDSWSVVGGSLLQLQLTVLRPLMRVERWPEL
jgi:hypothetical protein